MLSLLLTGLFVVFSLTALVMYPLYRLKQKSHKPFTISLMIDLNGHIDNKVKIEHD